jgi:uncharacterized protein (DUF433 family)
MSRRTELHRDARRIVTNENVMSGAPCFAGTRIPVASVVALFDYGYADSRVRWAYPTLTLADIGQARVWATDSVKGPTP